MSSSLWVSAKFNIWTTVVEGISFRASAVLSIGAATLADIYEPHERGTMMGVYYAAPLLGPSLGPLAGGILTQLFNWRATFWFLVIFGAVSLLSFVAFKDTFRRARSLSYQAALRKMQAHVAAKVLADAEKSQATSVSNRAPETAKPTIDEKSVAEKDLEGQGLDVQRIMASHGAPANVQEIRLTIKDVNPIAPLVLILKRKNNVVILCASGEHNLQCSFG